MQAALDGEVPKPEEGSVADVIQKWIAPVRIVSLPSPPSSLISLIENRLNLLHLINSPLNQEQQQPIL